LATWEGKRGEGRREGNRRRGRDERKGEGSLLEVPNPITRQESLPWTFVDEDLEEVSQQVDIS